MVNKFWYEKNPLTGEYDDWKHEEAPVYREYIQELIDLYCPDLYKIPEDITLDNLQQFLEVILKQYQYYNIKSGWLLELGDAIHSYFHRAYREEFPDTNWPTYPEGDRRQLTLDVLDNCFEGTGKWGHFFPEEVPFVIECINVPDEQVADMEDKLDKYFNQFDSMRRINVELGRRWQVLDKQRLEALEKGEPLPIRPMGIELDPCYKEGYPKKS